MIKKIGAKVENSKTYVRLSRVTPMLLSTWFYFDDDGLISRYPFGLCGASHGIYGLSCWWHIT